ncbi:MAG: potassium/proton antiporter [Kiloniellales bacterium]
MLTLVNLVILIGAALLVLSTFTSLLSRRLGVPILLVFLGIGLLVGVDGPGGITFDNAPLAYFIGSIAMAIILFDAGFETPWSTWRTAAGPGLVLATLGVLATAGLVGATAVYLIGVDWVTGLLLGAIVASTDAAAVFLLLRMSGVNLRERVKSTLEIESGSNDPVAIFLALGLVPLVGTPNPSDLLGFALAFLQQFSIGGAGGVLGGFLILWLLKRLDLEEGLAPLLVAGLTVTLFSAVNLVDGSGFLAVYVAGLVVGNGRMHGRVEVQRFQTGLTWLCQIALFLTLGLLATPSEFLDVGIDALIIAAVLMFLARPLAVWIGLLPFRFSRAETLFVSWVGLRGAVSIMLAIVPLLSGHAEGSLLFNTAFIIVLTSLLLQGWTVRPLAKALKITVPPRIGPLERVELSLPGDTQMEVVAYRVRAESPAASGRPLPRFARPALVLRRGNPVEPTPEGDLEVGDRAYLFATPDKVPLFDKLFAGSAEIDPKDRLFYGDFQLGGETTLGDLASFYEIDIEDEPPELTLAELFEEDFGDTVGPGDRLRIGPVELVAITTGQEQVLKVGLLLDPPPKQRAILYLPTGKEILSVFRKKSKRRHAASKSLPSAPDPTQSAPPPSKQDKTS